LLVAVDAADVDAQKDFDAVPGAAGGLASKTQGYSD